MLALFLSKKEDEMKKLVFFTQFLVNAIAKNIG